MFISTQNALKLVISGLILIANATNAFEVPDAEWQQMQKDIAELRAARNRNVEKIESKVDCALDNKYGPNAPVYTKTGKLRLGGLVQVWYYQFLQHDNRGLFDDPNNSGVRDQLNGLTESSFRIRRAELHFNMDMTENVTSYVVFDPAREPVDFPTLPWQSSNVQGFKRVNNVAPEWIAVNSKSPGFNQTSQIAAVQGGTGLPNRALQDAWIDYHDAVPNHDFMIGQMHPWFGEDGIRNPRELDFVERSMIGYNNDTRDLGASVHGAWWDVDSSSPAWSKTSPGRFQYWLYVMDGAQNYHTSGIIQNRPDDNQQKDLGYRVLVRPLWKAETWGSLELGDSHECGEHGNGNTQDPIVTPSLNLNRAKTWAYRHDAWAYYAPGSVAKGWWVRGEWATYHDRLAPGSIIAMAGNGDNPKALYAQDNPLPFTSHGWFVSTGYKLSESVWNTECNNMPSWLKPMEFTFRYDNFQNIQVANPADSARTSLYYTKVWTGGINYYLKGNNAKIMMDYNKVVFPNSNVPSFTFHKTQMDNLMMNFQVGF